MANTRSSDGKTDARHARATRTAKITEPTNVAAGGLLWRCTKNSIHLAVVRREKYNDWSLPKGKKKEGESIAAAAIREVREETGIAAQAGEMAGAIQYLAQGAPKTVVFWHMKPNDVGEDPGNTELPLAPDVSELRWVTPETAEELLTYERERNLVRAGPPAVGREPRLLSRLVARVLGRTRDTMFPGPERKRLRSSIEVTRSSLSYALAKGEAAGSWTVSAHNLLTAAAEEARG